MNNEMTKLTVLKGARIKTTEVQARPARIINLKLRRKNMFGLLTRSVATGMAVILSNWSLHGGAISTINAYIGFAKTLKSVVAGFVGETTVTPACALGRWDHYDYGIYGKREDGGPNFFGQHLQVIRNPYTGELSYRTAFRDHRTGKWYEVSKDVIEIPSVSRMTWTCVPNPGAPFIYNTLEDFSIQVWAASVKKTGYFAPGEPYTAYMKCDGTSRQYNCAHHDFTPRQTKIRSTAIPLKDSGVVSVKMPIVQYEYSFPPLLWVGDWKDY